MEKRKEIGSLIVRVVLGAIFLVHGFMKFAGGIENVAGFFKSVGLPGFLAYAVGTIELVGGILMLLGLGTQVVAALFAIVMVGAIVTVKLGKGFVGGYEFELALLAMSVHLLLSGSRLYAIDSVWGKNKSPVRQSD